MINLIEIKWDVLGAKLASLPEEEQSKFFTGFAKELQSWDTHYQREVQMMCINGKLSKEAKETLEKYMPSLWLEDKE